MKSRDPGRAARSSAARAGPACVDAAGAFEPHVRRLTLATPQRPEDSPDGASVTKPERTYLARGRPHRRLSQASAALSPTTVVHGVQRVLLATRLRPPVLPRQGLRRSGLNPIQSKCAVRSQLSMVHRLSCQHQRVELAGVGLPKWATHHDYYDPRALTNGSVQRKRSRFTQLIGTKSRIRS